MAVITSLPVCGQRKPDEQQRDEAFYNATNKWFAAWKLVSKDIYKIARVRPFEFVFFDDKFVYSISATAIKNGIPVKGCNLMNLKLHNDSLTLPDKSVVPVNLMPFAAENSTDGSKSFFVKILPGFLQLSGINSKELGLCNLVTGVFINEFSHSQQMQNFGKKMPAYEQQNNSAVAFSDDIVQNIYGKDTTYSALYKKETGLLFQSTKNNALEKDSLNEGLKIINQRQKKCITGKYENLKPIENFFVTKEGLGQYTMFLWLTNPKEGNIKREIAIEGVRRDRSWWSQDEGFALFLNLDNLTLPKTGKWHVWRNTESVTALIDRLNDKKWLPHCLLQSGPANQIPVNCKS